MAGEKKRRRNRGEGSIEETADGRFRIRYSYVDSRGERQKPSKTCDTRKQCYTWYAEQVGKSHGTYDTFDQWFTAWLEIQRASRRVIWLRTSTRKVREFIGAGGMGKFQPDPSR